MDYLVSIILNTYRIQVDNPGMKDPYGHTSQDSANWLLAETLY